MNYQKIYNGLMNNKSNRQKSSGVYYEVHHIIPKCLGGTDDKTNLVLLTAREHYIAHRLLYTIHKTSKLAHAWFCMTRTSTSQQSNRTFTSRQYSIAKTAHSKAMSTYTNSKNSFYGKKHNALSKQQMTTTRNKTYTENPEHYNDIITARKKRMSLAHKGIPKSKDHRVKIGKHSKGLMVIKNIITGASIRIPVRYRGLYSKHIWYSPYSISRMRNSKTVSCPHCNKTSEANNASFKKWHFNNCKKSPNYVKIYARKRVYKKFWSPWFESKCNNDAMYVYSKLFNIEQLLNNNLHLGKKNIILLLMSMLKFSDKHRYYVRTCRNNILAGKFCKQSKHNLLLTLGIEDESNKH